MFAECPPQLGCSVVLRSKSKSDLLAAKRILRYAILALYSNSLEVKTLTVHGIHLTKRCIDCVVCTLNVDEADDSLVCLCYPFHYRLLTVNEQSKWTKPAALKKRQSQSPCGGIKLLNC